MIKKSIFLLINLIIGLAVRGSSIPFSPIIKNYSVADYDAGVQNWSVEQDSEGVMYFGNNMGLLEFDGFRWRIHALPGKSIVRSVYVDEAEGRIYVGSYEEFGYFERTETNELQYQSLTPLLHGFTFHNDEIWNIFRIDHGIVFHSFGSLFVYDGRTVTYTKLEPTHLNFFAANGLLYSQQIDGDLYTWDGKEFHSSGITRRMVGGSDIIRGFDTPDGLLLFTREQGIYREREGKVERLPNACNELLKKHIINKVEKTKDGSYVIGTISGGIYALDTQGRLLWQANTDNGMQNNTVLALFCDAANNLWAALDEGVTYIQSNSTIYCYEPPHANIGMIYDILVKENKTYIASNQGLYCLSGGRITPIPGLEEQTWYIKEVGNQIFCGHNKGTFFIQDQGLVSTNGSAGGMCLTEMEIKGTTYLLEGTYHKLTLYERKAGSKLFDRGTALEGVKQMIRKIEVDHQGNIWAKHWQKGLFHLRLSDDLREVKEIRNYPEIGDRHTSFLSLFKVNGRVVFSDGLSFYTYEDLNDAIIPYEAMNEQLSELKGIHFCTPAQGNCYWFLGNRTAYLVECEMNRFRVVSRIPYSLFNGTPIEYNESIIYDQAADCSYLCLNNMIVRIEAHEPNTYKSDTPTRLRISRFKAEEEAEGRSLLLPIRPGNRIEANHNSVEFTLSYPTYDNHNYRVRYYLEGLSNQWIEGDRRLLKRYSRLPYGNYTFHAEVYDADRILASVQCPFTILRPWYISYWAIFCYIIIGVVLLSLSFYVVYAYAKRKRDRMIEQQRLAHQAEIEQREKKFIELEKQQLEADLKNKSKELSGVVMTNIAHQEFLKSLKEEMQQQKLSGQYTKKNLDKLLSLVTNNIVSDEENWNVFQANFDRIHENFFRNLTAQYPELTSSDLRFCALLRLNLPSKEIAKFLNISIRGVDAARYRLRKKFGLSQEDSLTNFVINFK